MKINLAQGLETEIDDEDWGKVKEYKWFPEKSGNTHYVKANTRKLNGERIMVKLHRMILDAPQHMEVDHIDGNGLNNKKENLRLCSHLQNSRNRGRHKNNTSGWKGVYWCKRDKKYIAQIAIGRKNIHLGSYDDSIQAAKAYDQKARELFGEFARLNFPEDWEERRAA